MVALQAACASLTEIGAEKPLPPAVGTLGLMFLMAFIWGSRQALAHQLVTITRANEPYVVQNWRPWRLDTT